MADKLWKDGYLFRTQETKQNHCFTPTSVTEIRKSAKGVQGPRWARIPRTLCVSQHQPPQPLQNSIWHNLVKLNIFFHLFIYIPRASHSPKREISEELSHVCSRNHALRYLKHDNLEEPKPETTTFALARRDEKHWDTFPRWDIPKQGKSKTTSPSGSLKCDPEVLEKQIPENNI